MQLRLGTAIAAVAVAGVGYGATAGGVSGNGLPRVTAPPRVTGIALLGQALQASAGTWSGSRPLTLAYQWQRCPARGGSCVPVPGATGRTHVLGAADVGSALEVQVTATNASGSAAASSSRTTAVAASPPAGAVRLPGGGFSLPVGAVAAPDRLAVSTSHVPTGSGGALLRVDVVDAAGYPVSGALVSLTTLPFGLFRPAAAVTTSPQGLAPFTLQPAPHAWISRGLVPAAIVSADAPGTATPSAIAASSLAQLGRASSSGASPYTAESRGYDLSYPNCRSRPGGNPAFAVVGVNGGRPFTFNPCLGQQSTWVAQGPQAVYLNSGYEPGYRRLITPACALAARSRPGAATAYAIGCSEAASSLERTTLLGLAPAIWWLDVEPSNAWSTSRGINVGVLRGMLDFLARLTPTPTVGIYSRPSWWQEITGGWATGAPEWIPSPGGICPSPFSTGPVWLAQTGSATLDLDTGC